MSHTHTYATLDVSESTFTEIRNKLRNAGYADQFEYHKHADEPYLIDMHGIALTLEAGA